jgi:hypothetical protein
MTLINQALGGLAEVLGWLGLRAAARQTLEREEDLLAGQLRFGGHTDSGGLTLLRTDMDGLQVRACPGQLLPGMLRAQGCSGSPSLLSICCSFV